MKHLNNSLWAILPKELQALRGRKPRESLILAPEAARPQASPGQPSGRVAILPIFGVMSQHADSWWAETSTELIGRVFGSLVADASIKAIVLNCNSPGGSVFGTEKLAQQIFDARGEKRIVAVANSLMASANYLVASQAHEVVADPGALVGNIGVIYQHVDVSKALDQAGIKVSTITAGKFKHEGHVGVPMDENERAAIEGMVGAYYQQFVEAVARGRGVKASQVRSGFGEGRALHADAAKAAGLVDKIATLEDTVAKLSSRFNAATQAELPRPGLEARERRLRWAE